MGAGIVAQAGAALGEAGGFGAALRQARAADAAHLEAVRGLSDAKSLRLLALKDELAGFVASSAEARAAFELALVPGDPPRLWIDLTASVVMEPDPKTYRLVRDGHGVFETADRAEMVQQAKLSMAHGIIARRRQQAVPNHNRVGGSASVAALILAGIGGFFLGALTLLCTAIYLETLGF